MAVDRPTEGRGSETTRLRVPRWLASVGLLGVLLAPWRGGMGADLPASAGASAAANARLVIEVVDAEGKLIPGVVVTVDGLPAGRTDAQGRFVEARRAPGEVLAIGINVAGGKVKVQPIRLVEGEQRHVLALDTVVVIDVDADGVAEPGDNCVGSAEVNNGYADTDGCPDALAQLMVTVTDPDGFAASGATVLVDGVAAGRTDAGGVLRLADKMPGQKITLSVSGGGWTDGVAEITPEEWDQDLALALQRSPDAASQPPVLSILAVDRNGVPVADGLVVVDGHKQGKTGPDGVFEYAGRTSGTTITVAVGTTSGDQHAVTSVKLAGGPQRALLTVEPSAAPPEIVAAEAAAAAAALAAIPAPGGDRDGDGLFDLKDTCPDGAEVANGFEDADGCPDDLATLAVWVIDPDGKAVAGASVLIDGRESGRTGDDGSWTLADQMPGRKVTVGVRAEHREPADGAPAVLVQGRQATTVALVSKDSDGDTIVDRDDRCLHEPERVNGYLDTDGCVDALASLAVVVTGADGTPLSGVEVAIGGKAAGRTDAAGRVLITDQMPGTEVEVGAGRVPGWKAAAARGVALVEGPQTATVSLEAEPVAVAQAEPTAPAPATDAGPGGAAVGAAAVGAAAIVAAAAPEPPSDGDGDGLADGDDGCADKPETRNGYKDDDGCPDALADVALTVTSGGKPLAGAVVTSGGRELGRAGKDGVFRANGLVPDEASTWTVTLPGYEPADVPARWKEGEQQVSAVLLPGDRDGDGIVDLYDACQSEAESPNGWREEDGCPDQLATIDFVVTGAGGKALAGAVVTRGGAEVGRTGADGRLVLADVLPGQAGAYSVSVPGSDYGAVEVPGELPEGKTSRTVALVRGDLDADAIADGDDTCPDKPEVVNGWKDTDGCPDRLSTVFVTATDPSGAPLPGVVVKEGAVELGRTDAKGELKLPERAPGASLVLSGSMPGTDRADVTLAPVQLVEGASTQTIVLARTDTDGDGMFDSDDACRSAGESKNGWRDEDGCPDALASVTVSVVDDAGAPIEGVVVSSGGKEHGRTGPDGKLEVTGLMPGVATAFALSKPGTDLLASEIPPITPKEGPQAASLSLGRKDTDGDGLADSRDGCATAAETVNGYADADGCPDALGRLVVEAKGADGKALPGAPVTVDGREVGRTDAAGLVTVSDLVPGKDVTVAVGAPSDRWIAADLGTVHIVEGDQKRAARLESIPLAELVVTVTGEGGKALAGAAVAEGGTVLGRTAADGTLRIAERVPGNVRLVVSAPGTDYVQTDLSVDLAEGRQARQVGLVRADSDSDGFADGDDGCPKQAEAVNEYQDDDGCPDEKPAPPAPKPEPPAPKPEPVAAAPEPAPAPEPVAAAVVAASAAVVAVAAPAPVPVPEPPPAPAPPADTDGDEVTDNHDQCPKAAETKNGHKDGDGCPDELATVLVEVLDPEGKAVAGATVALEGRALGKTDAQGVLRIPDLRPEGSITLTVTPVDPNMEPAAVVVDLAEGDVPAPVDLVRSAPPDADLDGVVDLEDRCPDRPETKNGVQDTDGCPESFASIRLELTDPAGAPVSGAELRVGGRVIGTTAADGSYVLADLVVGSKLLVEVAPPAGIGLLPHSVVIDGVPEKGETRAVQLPPAGKGVRVVVRSADGGAPIPSLAVLHGPVDEYTGDGSTVIDVRTGELVVEVALGDDGEEVLELPRGTWRIVFLAREHIPDERTIEVTGAADLVTIDVSLTKRRTTPAPAPIR